MKTFILLLLALAGLTGCVVVPVEPAYVGPPRMYSAPPPVVVVPGRPYYRHGYYGHRYPY